MATAQFIPGSGSSGAAGVASLSVSGVPLAQNATTGAITLTYSTTNCQPGFQWMYDGTNWQCLQTAFPRRRWGCDEEYTGSGATNNGPCFIYILSGSTLSTTGAAIDVSHPGLHTWLVDALNDRVSIITGNSTGNTIAFGVGATYWTDFIFQIDVTSDATNTWTLRAGFCDSINADCTDGIYVELNPNVDTEFQCKVAQNGTRTTLDSGITFATATWYRVRIEEESNNVARILLGAAGAEPTQICGAISLANLPLGTARATQAGMQFIATGAGTGARNLTIDYAGWGGYPTTGGR